MPLDDEPLPLEQQDLVRRWVDAGAPRGVAVALSAGARATASAPDRPRRVRFVRSLEVVLQSDVKLAPNTLNAKKGGALSIALPIGPLPPVTALAFRGDNRLLAVGVYAEVVVWDLRDGQAVQAIAEIPGPVHALAFSRDGRRLAVGAGLPARSGVVQVYSVPDGTKLHDFAGHGDVVTAVALRPDGAQIASASFDQTVRLWSLGRNRPEGVFHGHSDFVHTLAYTPDGRSLLSGGKDRTVKRINPQTLQEERAFSAPDEVLALAVHPDGKRFVSAGNDSEIRWWAYGATKPVSRRGGHSGPVQQLAFSGDGQLLVSAGADGSVRLWSGKTGELRRQLGRGGEWQYAAAISGDGRLAASGGWDGLVRLWDAESGRLRATLVQPPPVTFSPNDETSPQRLDWLAVSPAGYVNGSPELIAMARWRADGDALPAEAVRRVCASADSIARAMRGESLKAVSFTPNAGK